MSAEEVSGGLAGRIVFLCTVVGCLAAVYGVTTTFAPVTVERPLAEDFLIQYWHLATEDPAKAYAMLDDTFKRRRAGDFPAFSQRFKKYSHIEVSQVEPPEGGYVSALITYYSAGQTPSAVPVEFELQCPESSKWPWTNHCDVGDVKIHDSKNPFH